MHPYRKHASPALFSTIHRTRLRALGGQAVQWLHESGVCPASLAILDDVAAGGKLDTVVWLSERGAGASEAAVDRAAEAGHADVVDYLLKNRQEVGCLTMPYALILLRNAFGADASDPHCCALSFTKVDAIISKVAAQVLSGNST